MKIEIKLFHDDGEICVRSLPASTATEAEGELASVMRAYNKFHALGGSHNPLPESNDE